MALDHALAVCLGEGEAVLRLYGWNRPTVSFGRNEPARALYGGLRGQGRRGSMAGPTAGAAPTAGGAAGVGAAAGGAAALDFVRRPTGGRAVVHARELTYAVVAPVGAWGGLRAAYVAINEALGAALRTLGAPVELAAESATVAAGPVTGGPSLLAPGMAQAAGSGRSRGTAPGLALPPHAGPCFRSPAPGEVTAAGRKLVGSAQARLRGALLQHGSILLDDDQGLLEGLLDRRWKAGRPATLRELVGDMSIDHLTDMVAMSLRETFGGRWTAEGWRPSELEAAGGLEAERYALDSWTWRR